MKTTICNRFIAREFALVTQPLERIKYLMVREGWYYFKRKIPTNAAKAFQPAKQQILRSLGTKDYKVAVEALATENAKFEAILAIAKGKKPDERMKIARAKERMEGTTKYLMEAHISSLLDRYRHAILLTDDEVRKGATVEDRLEMRKDYELGLQVLYEDAAAENFEAWTEIANDLLSGERLIAPPNSAARISLIQQLMQADIELLEIQLGRLTGKVYRTPPAPQAPRSLPTMRDLFVNWRLKQKVERTINTYEAFVAQFEAFHGAIPVAAITPRHVRGFSDELLKSRVMKDTAANRLGALSTLFRYGQPEVIDPQQVNPFENANVDKFPSTPLYEERRAYTIKELQILFNSKTYTESYVPKGQTVEALYWAPLMGPFVGARIEEIAQLNIDDIELINGRWSILITAKKLDHKLKNPGSARRVPMHIELIKCGLLAYAAEQKLKGHTKLFPSLRNQNQNQIWSNALTKKFGSYMTSIGLGDPRLDFHSFRYIFRQQCTNCGVELEARDALSGHWLVKDQVGRTYLKEENRMYPFPALCAAIGKLSYNELSLAHLYVDDPYSNALQTLQGLRQDAPQ